VQPVKFDLLHQLTLLTFEAATALSVVVVTIYWLFLFKGETDIGSLWFNLVVHGMESRGNRGIRIATLGWIGR
jgi:hypothetical protein